MPPADPPPDDQADVQALAADVGRLAGELVRVDDHVRQLADLITDMAGGGQPGTTVRPWLTETDPSVAAVMLDSLTEWLAQVWMHYPGHKQAPPLPDCWAHHPWLIEELWTARGAWRDATGENGSYTKLATWHDTTRPGITQRIADHIGTCSRRLHQTGPSEDDPDRRVPTADVDTVATAWAVDRRIPTP